MKSKGEVKQAGAADSEIVPVVIETPRVVATNTNWMKRVAATSSPKSCLRVWFVPLTSLLSWDAR